MDNLLVFVLIFVFSIQISCSNAANCTSNNITLPYNSTYSRRIYQFQCYSIDPSNQMVNPSIPLNFLPNQTLDYNEMDLSPNRYIIIPSVSLCMFKKIEILDLSFNLITDLIGMYDLKCLSRLHTIDLSNNKISTSFAVGLFDDTFASNIKSLNLTNNQIQAIHTLAFIKEDGTSRFPKLEYLGLANNKIIYFDLLWPLSLPSPNLLVDIKFNPIQTLVNELNSSYKNPIFSYAAMDKRYVDATTNNLQFMDDNNLLQYGLKTQDDFMIFLNMISNYDFRQSNLVRTFICYCPPKGLLTVYWYQGFKNVIEDKSAPVYNLFCSNNNGEYIFDFPCPFSQQLNETTIQYPLIPKIKMITQSKLAFNATVTTLTRNLTLTNSSNSSLNAANLLLGIQKANSSVKAEQQITSINTEYFYLLFLLLIPFFIILILLFICCLGRWCQLQTNQLFDLLLCPCMRPDDEKAAQSKFYDATICYSEYDEGWLDEQFLPQLSQFENNFKIHKLSLYHRSSDKLNRENEKILRGSKRIILIFSKKFLEEEWSNKSFRSVLREICLNDKLCVIVCINVGEFRQKKLDKLLLDIEISLYDYLSNDNRRPLLSKIRSIVKYNCGLNNLERLNIDDSKFWKKFNYIMPRIGYDNTKPAIITDSSRDKKIIKLPKLMQHASRGGSFQNQTNRSNTKRSQHQQNDSQISLSKQQTCNGDAHLSYASNYKESKSLRHIIVPIPDFMRTQLGYGNTKSVGIGDDTVNKQQAGETKSSYNLNSSAVTPEKVVLDHKLPPLLISNQQQNPNKNNNKISIVNQNIDFLPNQAHTLVKNFLLPEREVIRIGLANSTSIPHNSNLMDRNEGPQILDLFKPKSAHKKMKIRIEEAKL